jgi:hypothetical protein
LLTLHWLLTVAAVLIAALALGRARRVTKRLERLTESYWELRYDHGQLRARVARLDPEAPLTTSTSTSASPAEQPRPQAGAATAFVPLSSLKR